jgi:hypothetical protein
MPTLSHFYDQYYCLYMHYDRYKSYVQYIQGDTKRSDIAIASNFL